MWRWSVGSPWCLLLVQCLWMTEVEAAPDRAASSVILAHDLHLILTPSEHRLAAIDRQTLAIGESTAQELVFQLHPSLHVESVLLRQGEQAEPLTVVPVPPEAKGDSIQRWTVSLDKIPHGETSIVLEWHYEGLIDDLPRDPGHLRFVMPSHTEGHIGQEGIYLSGETHWCPDLPGSLATFHVEVTLPTEWKAVTHGLEVAQRSMADQSVSVWEVTARTEALTLVANRFVTQQRQWTARTGQHVQLMTYLFPEDARLADEYLDATARYLDTYIALLGPYPFPKFAVVENFFASGLGMPSFTLLGSGTIKRHYVQPYALGHEIVHSWIGNSVLNDPTHGNWVEGLTTYLSNYYYEELTGSSDQAREQRRLMLLGYAVYVTPQEEYPIARFTQKTDQKDNAIGYQKTAMVFHMLRREVGEEVFWIGLRTLVARFTGTYATWTDVEAVFSESAGTSLRWFFQQWVERPGAPVVRMRDVRVEEAGTPVIRLVLEQTLDVPAATPYRVTVPLTIRLADGKMIERRVTMTEMRQSVEMAVPDRPVGVSLDPQIELFQRWPRQALPAMLNVLVTDPQRGVLPPTAGTEADRVPYQQLALQITQRDPEFRLLSPGEGTSASGSVLVLGGSGLNRAAEQVAQSCGSGMTLSPDAVTIAGKEYRGEGYAFLVSCRRTDDQNHVLTLFGGLSSTAVEKVARLLFFYGWQSYVVFHNGSVMTRGTWESPDLPQEVQF